MKIIQMRQILEICKCGSINKAAEKLYISQSSLSASVIAAENELGVELLTRNRNGVIPTPAGEAFVETAKAILMEYDALLDKFKTERLPRLYISSQYLRYANMLFAKISDKFKDKGIELQFLEKQNYEILNDLIQNESDIGIIVTPTLSREKVFTLLHKNSLEGHIVAVDESRCLIGKNNPLYYVADECITTAQLADFPRLDYQGQEWSGDLKIFTEESSYFPCSRWIYISDSGSLNNMLTHSTCFFIGVYNERAYRSNDFYENLRALKISDRVFTFDTIWIHRKGWTVDEPSEYYLRELYKTAGQYSYDNIMK